jgi:SAM-dependent methyltransferase
MTICMPVEKKNLEEQLRRQSIWLKESWLWLMRKKVLGVDGRIRGRPSALEVGCGPGFVMEVMKEICDVKGLDIDGDMVSICRGRGLDATEGDGENMPFDDESFDIAYCSFLLLWVRNPKKVVSEMKRVSRRWVICLAEPDFGGRLDHPQELGTLSGLIMKGIEKDGGDPLIGRKLREIFSACGLKAEVGVHPGVWDIEKLREESEGEWRYIRSTTEDRELSRLRSSWDESLEKGTLFQFNPIFYAFAEKKIESS